MSDDTRHQSWKKSTFADGMRHAASIVEDFRQSTDEGDTLAMVIEAIQKETGVHQVGNEVGKAAPGVYTIGRWDYDDEDRAFYHTDFSTDAILKLDGDWSSVQQRQEFAARVLKALHYEFVAGKKP